MAYEASPVTLSKKLSNGHHGTFAGASVYDGVFASPSMKVGAAAATASLSCCAEDYGEIFRGGSEASSIPFLDVPELRERKVSVDVRSSKLDYSKIFGAGGGDSSFAARFEEFSFQPNARKKSEKEWTPSDRMSPSEASKRSSISDTNDVWSPEASYRANGGVKKFNMSFNKINDENAKGMSGANAMTHIAQLDAVRGYVHLVDEATPPCKIKGDQPVASLVSDCCQKTSTYQATMESSNFVRASEDIPLGKTLKQNSGADVGFQSSPNWFKSNSMGKHEVRSGSGNPCSGVPSSTNLPRDINLGYSDGRSDPDGGSTSISPPFFEEEMDTNSVAATSAAALRKAIEEAQARIKVAKEIMEKKKVGLRNGSKSFSDKLKPKERKDVNVVHEVSKSRKKKTHVLREEVDIPLHATSGVMQHNTTGPSFVAAKFEVRERVPSSENGETSRNNMSSQADRRCEEAEVPVVEQFYDVENTGENWSSTIEVDVPKLSAITSKQNVTGQGQGPEDFEAQKFVSSARENARETLCNNVNSTQADHRPEKSDPAEVAEQFYEFEEVTRVQAVDENVQKENTFLIAEDGFEKPQEGQERSTLAKKEDESEEVEKKIEIQNGICRLSDCSKDCSEGRIEVEVFHKEESEQKQQFYTNHKEGDEIIQSFDEGDNRVCSPKEFLEPLNDKLLEIGELDDVKRSMRNLTTGGCLESESKGEEENEKEQNHAHGLEDNDKSFFNKAIKGERIKEKLNRFHLGKKIAKILSHDVELELIEKTHERDVSQKKENENSEEVPGQWVDIGRISTKTDPSDGDGGKTKAAVEEPRNQVNDTVDHDENKNHKLVMITDGDENLIVSEEAPLCKYNSSSMTELSKCVMEADDSVEEKCVVEKTDVLRTSDSHQGLQLIKRVKPMEHETESVFMGQNSTSDEGSRSGTNIGRKRWDKPACQFEIINNLRENIKNMSLKFENVEYMKKSEAAINQEDDEDIECFDEQGRFIGITMEEPQSSNSSEGDGESVRLYEETESSTSREKDPENDEEISISQNAEANEESQKETSSNHSKHRKEVDDRPIVNEDNNANESLKKEVEQERKQRRRMDEAKEREREIEKGRIAVERAVREARERAFAEARERAAKEKAGARQRVKAETRERVGKPSGEPNPKSVTDKAREAKLKAERAAVERATAEARERALEKAMSSKTASQAKKQNPQHKGPSSTSTSRYQHSSNGGVSNSAERSDGGNGESTHRSKARSERHQRISERAEKALAEKNRRDLLAQKEQAERNRLAETLDIEVKRWSSGKEGNLRALLSTLQYILGPDSGWQPIPLTDVITTTAVKKAYRKATLFVHPDKLQQRGANIQQKYTCEKVFDLLKEAWNKFNIEER